MNTHNDVWTSGASTVYRHAWGDPTYLIELQITVGEQPTPTHTSLFAAVVDAVTKAINAERTSHD